LPRERGGGWGTQNDLNQCGLTQLSENKRNQVFRLDVWGSGKNHVRLWEMTPFEEKSQRPQEVPESEGLRLASCLATCGERGAVLQRGKHLAEGGRCVLEWERREAYGGKEVRPQAKRKRGKKSEGSTPNGQRLSNRTGTDCDCRTISEEERFEVGVVCFS